MAPGHGHRIRSLAMMNCITSPQNFQSHSLANTFWSLWPRAIPVSGLVLLQCFGGLYFIVSVCWFQDILGEGDCYPVASFCFCNPGGLTFSFLAWFPLKVIFLLPNSLLSFPQSSSWFFCLYQLKHFQRSFCTLLFLVSSILLPCNLLICSFVTS